MVLDHAGVDISLLDHIFSGDRLRVAPARRQRCRKHEVFDINPVVCDCHVVQRQSAGVDDEEVVKHLGANSTSALKACALHQRDAFRASQSHGFVIIIGRIGRGVSAPFDDCLRGGLIFDLTCVDVRLGDGIACLEDDLIIRRQIVCVSFGQGNRAETRHWVGDRHVLQRDVAGVRYLEAIGDRATQDSAARNGCGLIKRDTGALIKVGVDLVGPFHHLPFRIRRESCRRIGDKARVEIALGDFPRGRDRGGLPRRKRIWRCGQRGCARQAERDVFDGDVRQRDIARVLHLKGVVDRAPDQMTVCDQ